MSQSFRIFIVALAGCLLASCSLTPTLNAPAGYLAPEVADGHRKAEREIQAYALVGETIRLRGHLNYSHYCHKVIPTHLNVVQAPQHGTLSVRDEAVTLTNPELGHNRGCAGATGMGKAIYYTRASEGADVLDYDSVSSNGVVRVHAMIEDEGPFSFLWRFARWLANAA
jgi:hypothetical protein